MTTSILESTTTSTLSAALAPFGLTLVPADAASAIQRVAGPLLVSEGSRQGAALPEAIVAFTDRSGDTTEAAAQALIEALTQTISGLTVGDLQPTAELGSIVAAYPSISESLLIMDAANPVGVVLWVADRRANGAGAGSTTGRGAGAYSGLTMLRDVELDVSVELGRTEMTLAEVLALHVGSVVELDRPAGAPVDVRVNGTLLARGEVVVIDGEYAVRIAEVIDPDTLR